MIIVDQDTYGGGCNGGGASPSYAGSLCYSYRSSAAKLLLNQPEINHHHHYTVLYTSLTRWHRVVIQKKNLHFTPCGSEIVATTTAIFHPVARHSGTPKLVALRVSGVIKHLELQVSLWLRLDMWHGCINRRPTERKITGKKFFGIITQPWRGYKLCTSRCLDE